MAQLEELLEKKPDAVSEDMGYSTPSDAYPEDEWEKQKLKGWPRQIHVFGMRQNQINRGTAARLRALEIQNRTLEIKIQRLEEELEAWRHGRRRSWAELRLKWTPCRQRSTVCGCPPS